MSFSIFVRHLKSGWNICFLLPTAHFRDYYDSSEISQWHVLLFNEDVSNTYTKPNCSFCHLLPLLKKKKIIGILKFCELKWELPVWRTPTVRSCGRKYLKTWNYLALLMSRVMRDHCLCKYDWAFAIHFCPQHEDCRNCGAQRGDIYTEILWFESLSPAQILNVVFESQKFRFEIHCHFCAEMNFLHLYNPIKIQMLVRNSDGCIPSEISNQPTLGFATPCDWVQCLPLCRNVYRVLSVMTESVSV